MLEAGLFSSDKRMVKGGGENCQFSRRAQTLAVASLDVYVNLEHPVLI